MSKTIYKQYVIAALLIGLIPLSHEELCRMEDSTLFSGEPNPLNIRPDELDKLIPRVSGGRTLLNPSDVETDVLFGGW